MNPSTIGMLRAGIALLGQMFTADMIPTGIDGLGPKIGAVLVALALAIPAGDKTTVATIAAAEKEALK
jgi:hypothetical protein